MLYPEDLEAQQRRLGYLKMNKMELLYVALRRQQQQQQLQMHAGQGMGMAMGMPSLIPRGPPPMLNAIEQRLMGCNMPGRPQLGQLGNAEQAFAAMMSMVMGVGQAEVMGNEWGGAGQLARPGYQSEAEALKSLSDMMVRYGRGD